MDDSVEFVLENFVEANKLWVRMHSQVRKSYSSSGLFVCFVLGAILLWCCSLARLPMLMMFLFLVSCWWCVVCGVAATTDAAAIAAVVVRSIIIVDVHHPPAVICTKIDLFNNIRCGNVLSI